MASRLMFCDLFELPGVGARRGIYWLRLYRDDGQSVAVLTEVPGNPGPSVTNAQPRLALSLVQRFDLCLPDLTIFEIWPSGAGPSPGVAKVIVGDGSQDASWRHATREEVVAMVGMPLAPLPGHDELYRQVKLMGGGTTNEIWRRVFVAVDPTTFPPPHDPSQCEHYQRFTEIEAALHDLQIHDELAPGRKFLVSLSSPDFATCRYHRADWRAIADESVRILRSVDSKDQREYEAAAWESPLGGADVRWLASLFSRPITVPNDGTGFTDGQHRGCALRASGAQRVAVVVGRELVDGESGDWTYEGDG